MADIALMLHGSLQWGVRHVEEWHFLAEIYARSLAVLNDVPAARLTCQFGGQDVEWLAHTHPELIEQVCRLADAGRVEIAVGGYSHNFQGATPAVNVANLRLAQAACRAAFGRDSDGYWPAESMLNRGTVRALNEAGFAYTMFDSLNVRRAGRMEYAVCGRTFRLAGAFGETIPGLPVSRFRDCQSRGEGAGILRFAMNPGAFDGDPALPLERAGRTDLIVEVSDWEHFNRRQGKVQAIEMGTASTGGGRNEIDPDKLDAWRRILSDLAAAGHTFVTCREALERHEPAETLELIDGRDYTKNDLTRLVDACAWHGGKRGGLSGRKDPHRMSDQESYCYSFAGARALQHTADLTAAAGPPPDFEAREKDVAISFCSAHRSGGEEYTVKQQVLDRVNRAIEQMHAAHAAALGEADELLLPADLPAGAWPVPLHLPDAPGPVAVEMLAGVRRVGAGWAEPAALRINCLRRTHRLWIDGPVPAGRYALRLGEADADAAAAPAVQVAEDDASLTLRAGDAEIVLDRLHGGTIAAWSVEGFAPFAHVGRVEMNAHWQDAPLLDEVPCEMQWRPAGGGVSVDCRMEVEDIAVTRRYRLSADLRTCQTDVHVHDRRFSYLSPLAYRLRSAALGPAARSILVAEGHTEIVAEPLAVPHNVHHLGSEMVGFLGCGGLAALAVDRLVSSPILRREPLSGELVLMDSRPIGPSDNAYPYTFAAEPVLEATLRIAPGGDAEAFAAWQACTTRRPITSLGEPTIVPAELDWMAAWPHVSEVNPYF